MNRWWNGIQYDDDHASMAPVPSKVYQGPEGSYGAHDSSASADRSASNVLNGQIRYKIFVYDPRPLDGMSFNDQFTADVMQDRVIMRSALNGSLWRSWDHDGLALGYHGRPFGVIFNEDLAKIIDHKHATKIVCILEGWFDHTRGIPEAKALAPPPMNSPNGDLISDLMHVSRYDIHDLYDIVTVWNYRDAPDLDALLVQSGGRLKTDVDVRMIPTPEVSSARPHVGVFIGDGKILEYNARNSRYQDMTTIIGRRVMLAEHVDAEDDEDPFYRILFLSPKSARSEQGAE
jgi:hypothetical protein